jgi:hypothetical protein
VGCKGGGGGRGGEMTQALYAHMNKKKLKTTTRTTKTNHKKILILKTQHRTSKFATLRLGGSDEYFVY